MGKQVKSRSRKGRPDQGAPVCRFSDRQLQSEALVPVILEFQQVPVAVYRRLNPQADPERYRQQLQELHRDFLVELDARCLGVKVGESPQVVAGPGGPQQQVVTHFFTEAFNGIGVWVPGRMVPEVATMAGVRAVTLNQERVYLNLDRSVPFVGGPQAWERLDPAGLPLKGEGIIVAVLDTGVDWTHPAFGGFADVPNEKVIHAASLTGEHPIDNFGHGTHVAAIIAGDSSYKGTPRGDSLVDGVAPRARLMGYKVLTAAGSGSASNIVLAIEDAVKRGAHVINLSLGDIQGDPFAPESAAANNAMLAGVVVCAAAGNSGPTRNTIGAPGAAHHVITVGASTDEGVTALRAELLEEGQPDRHLEMRLLEGSVALEPTARVERFVLCGRGARPADFPAALKGLVAVVERGDVTFYEKAMGAQKAGAVACLIYNNQPGTFFGTLGDEKESPRIPVVAINQEGGHLLREAINSETGISRGHLRLNPEGIPQPDLIAEFSSRGPNNDGRIKPELTAPGVNIYAATIVKAPTPGGGMPDPSGYLSASGTSMATPHVAGAAALIRQAHPDWTPLLIKAALVNTARFMPGQGSVMDQGNGAIDMLAALDCRAILVTDTQPFGVTHAFGRLAHGGGEKRVAQGLRLESLPGVTGEQEWELAVELGGVAPGLAGTVSHDRVLVRPGEPARVDLALSADGKQLPDGPYFGWVVARSGTATLRLPFYCEATRGRSEQPAAPSKQSVPARKRVGDLCCC